MKYRVTWYIQGYVEGSDRIDFVEPFSPTVDTGIEHVAAQFLKERPNLPPNAKVIRVEAYRSDTMT